MRSVLIIGAILAACAANTIPADVQDVLGERIYSRFIEMPDGKGNLHTVDLEETVDADIFGDERDGAGNEYRLYTKLNRDVYQLLRIDDSDSVYNSNFNFSDDLCVLIHGWLSDGNTDPNVIGRESIFDIKDCNVITVDWSGIAQNLYTSAFRAVPGVGIAVGRFLKFLNRLGMSFRKMHVIGLSLGAHVSGAAGRECDGQIARVTGLDPAGPLWHFSSNRLSKESAAFVEGIHTDVVLGIGDASGHADFFINGGRNQPGCLTPVCDHTFSQHVFFASYKLNHLLGNECDDMSQVRDNTCQGPLFEMGNHHLDKTGSGLYRVNTGSEYPYLPSTN